MILQAFPTLDSDLLKKVWLKRERPLTAAARGQGRESPVKCTPDSAGPHATVWQLESPSWHAETHALGLDYEMSLAMPGFLFGPNGLAPANGSVLGVAVQWVDADASQRGTIPLGELAATDRRRPWRIRGQVEFPRGTLRGTLRLYLILYLKTPGTPTAEERHLASTAGTVFGVLHEDRLVIEGNGSMFPVHQISDASAPLWRMVCSWDDLSDPVNEDTVCLELNQEHPDYPALITDGNQQWSPLMREVLAGALQVLITKAAALAEGPIHSGQDLHEGSIGHLVAYLQELYGLQVDRNTVSEDPEILAAAIRQGLRRSMSG